ncbi:MAG: hypothetical protein H7Y07_05985, partial [Pyrinomonadaceae bacterium]|nr:hypothetical protein [Sphingobacteriaceae bacterium]
MFLNYYNALLKFCVCILVVTALGCKHSQPKANISKGKFTMDQFMGINAFVDDPVDKLKAVGFIREYHNWEWDDDGKGYPKNELKWAPGIWNFDEFYQSINQAGLEIGPCIQGNVKWLHKNLNNLADKPIDEIDADTEDPRSYRKKAQFMFQFAARYGSTKIADTKLTLSANQPRNSGMKLIRYVEDWNEQNKSWEGKNAQFSAEEYAAMASADYDGHAKTMTGGNGNFGVKNADPNIRFVMGGLAGLKLSFVKDMKRWFEKNRADKKFAADVINFHVYAWKSEDGWEDGGPAKSPEEAGFREKLEEITAYRDGNLPGVEVWISEFGWDTNPGSPLCPPVIKPFDIQEIQAQWLVRSYLAFAAAGVDRAQAYMLRDVDPKSKIWYSSCGLMGPKGDWTPKKSWYYVYTMKNTLKNMKYAGEVLTNEPDLHIYKFKDTKTQQGVYAMWCGSSS